MDIVVAVATAGTPGGCWRTVEAVARQRLLEGSSLDILVVDNNAAPMPHRLQTGVHWIHEPTQGISSARNAAVRWALANDARILVFIDDDEVPLEADWLQRLTSALGDVPTDISTGPVISRFPQGTPSWIQQHPLFERNRYPTGHRLGRAATGNIALRTGIFREMETWFHPTLGLTGGGDTEFTMRAAAHGYVIRWVDEAAVEESVLQERTRVGWVLRRSWRLGINRAERQRLQVPGRPTMPTLVLGSLIEGLGGAAATLPLALVSRRLALTAAGRSARGLGALAGLCGVRYAEYRHRSQA